MFFIRSEQRNPQMLFVVTPAWLSSSIYLYTNEIILFNLIIELPPGDRTDCDTRCSRCQAKNKPVGCVFPKVFALFELDPGNDWVILYSEMNFKKTQKALMLFLNIASHIDFFITFPQIRVKFFFRMLQAVRNKQWYLVAQMKA